MNSAAHHRDEEALDEIASGWLCERDMGFTAERAKAFAAWRSADPRHAAAVARVEAAFALLAEMPSVREQLNARLNQHAGSAFAATDRARTLTDSPSTARRRTPLRPLVRAAWIALAAAAVVAFVALSSRRSDREGQGGGERIAAESAQRRVGLQDGSIIDLNAGSGLTVQYSPGQRAVTLEAGEAHFKVAPDPARPFVVSAGDVAVRAIGTAFNVRRLAQDEVEVLVIEGKVEVSRSGFSGAPDVNVRRLVAGERTRMERGETVSSARIEKVDTTAILAALAWQDGITRFSDVPLRDLVRQFNRHNRRQLVVADPELGARKIGGVLALDQVEAFVRLLEEDGDVVADRSSPSTIVLRRAR